MHLTPDPNAEPLILGNSRATEQLRATAARLAAGDAKVVITGESGVGKELIARYIHARSPRAARNFVAINCAGLSETLLETELFGHVKGSFTGAHRDKVGLLQLGHRGTVFLDEVGEMSPRMQALLLRFLESGEIKPVGHDAMPVRVDARIIAATHRSLPDLVAQDRFREDLMYRLMVVHLEVPAIRERPEDIRDIVPFLIAQAGVTLTITEEAMEALERYRWPGNVRELKNVIEHLASLHAGDSVGLTDLPARLVNWSSSGMAQARERRKTAADHLYDGLVARSCSFWEHVYPMFINRDLTRAEMIALVRRGLVTTSGNYRALLRLFGMAVGDYKRFLNLLSTHGCTVDFREFRSGNVPPDRPIEPVRIPTAKAAARRRVPNHRSDSSPV